MKFLSSLLYTLIFFIYYINTAHVVKRQAMNESQLVATRVDALIAKASVDVTAAGNGQHTQLINNITDSVREVLVLEAVLETHYETEFFCRGEWKSPEDCIDSKCDYKAMWQYIDDNDEIVFTVSTKYRNKWTGIAFSDNQLMPETDLVLGLVEDSGRFFLIDSWLRAYEAPPLDHSQDLYNMTAWRENGITTLRFIRKRITGDSRDFQFTDTNCPYLIFPVMGGTFNAINKRIRKHWLTPVISDRKVCIRSCKQSPSVVTVTDSTIENESKDSDNSIPTKKVLPINQKNSPEYILLQSDLQKQLAIEISKNFDTFKSVNIYVYQLKSDQNSNNVIQFNEFNIIVVDDKTIKWIIIFAGISALMCLVLIQTFCMLYRDSKNKETQTSKDKQIARSHWKDYVNALNAYAYEIYDTSGDELDAQIILNGQQSDGRSDKQERHQSGNKAYVNNINDKMLSSEKYMERHFRAKHRLIAKPLKQTTHTPHTNRKHTLLS